MPTIPKYSKCYFLGCQNEGGGGQNYCHLHRTDKSENQKQNSKLYNSTAWRKKRIAMQSQYPICAACLLEGRVVQTEHIDHVIPHRRVQERFLVNLFQGLCAPHHSIKTNLEKRGVFRHYTPRGIVDYTDQDYKQLVVPAFEKGIP